MTGFFLEKQQKNSLWSFFLLLLRWGTSIICVPIREEATDECRRCAAHGRTKYNNEKGKKQTNPNYKLIGVGEGGGRSEFDLEQL